MGLSANIKYRLNRLFGQTPMDVQLGDLIDTNYKVFAAGNFTTVGGDANESIAVSSMTASDIAIVNVRTPGATPRTIVSVTPGTGAIAVVMSDDPAADHVLSYIVLRIVS